MKPQRWAAFGVAGILLLCAVTPALSIDLKVVTVGDSITNGYFPLLPSAETSRGVSTIYANHAAGGLTSTRYINDNFAADIQAECPDLIFFMLGTNDVYSDAIPAVSFETYKTNIQTIFSQFDAAHGHPRVVVSTLIPITREGKEAANQRIIDWYNPWIKKTATSYNFEVLDLNTLIQQEDNWEELYNDGIHLWADSAAGYVWMADEWATQIQIPEPSTILMLALGIGSLLSRRRNKRK